MGAVGKDHPVIFFGETSLDRGRYTPFKTEFGKIGVIICYDTDFTDTARKVAKNGAQLLIIPSADWEGISPKHFTHAVFRAIENRTAIVKVDGNRSSVIIDPYGRITQKVIEPKGKEAILVGSVNLGQATSPLFKLGDWFGWISLIGLVFFAIFSGITNKRNK